SISDEQLPLTLPIDMREYGLGDECAVYRIDAKGRHRIGVLTKKNPSIKLNLEPRALCLLEFASATR
ncbi:MAG: hypothetical protein JWO95_582, partial [Verrucomicrobiales bacterium]|nr:hypothetical protein [Verrucomicrobiales bacterium]